MNFKTVVMPNYMSSFHCSGSQCETNCCDNEWNIVIDKNTYDKYLQITDPTLAPLFLKYLQRNTENPTEASYALMRQSENKRCVFKTSENLCLIHQKYGPEYLSSTCNTYPKIINVINNHNCEISGMISCPEIARLLLLNPDPIRIQENEVPTDFQKTFFTYKLIDLNGEPKKWLASILAIRELAIEIMQARSYPLADRLTFLGLFSLKLQETILDSPQASFPALCAKYQKIFRTGGALNLSTDIPPNPPLMYSLLQEMCEIKTIDAPKYREWLFQLYDGLGYSNQNSMEQNVENYRNTYLNYYQKFMADREYVYENYLVNQLFSNVFPLSENGFDAYLNLIIYYSLLKFHLIAMAGIQKGLDEPLLLHTVQSFSRFFEHDPLYLSNICTLLKEKNFANLAYMVTLIKDY